MRTVRKQRGAVLIITLLMLVVVMLLAITAVNNGMVNLRIVDNMRTVQEQAAATQEAAEELISSADNFYSPAERTEVVNDMNVWLSEPVCVWSQIVEGSSAEVEGQQEVEPRIDVYWEFDACVVEVEGGPCTASRITQGVRMRMLQQDQCS